MSATVAALIVVTIGIIASALIRPEEGPSQARAWEVCHEHAANMLDVPPGAKFGELPGDPSERVKLVIASDLYRVYSYYESLGAERQDFMCTVRYLGHDEWEVAALAEAP